MTRLSLALLALTVLVASASAAPCTTASPECAQWVTLGGGPQRSLDTLGVPVTYVMSNPSSYAYPDDARPTIAAYALTANAPGYMPETPADAQPFRPLGDARNCVTSDQWPFGLNNRSGYSAKQTDDQIRKQMASRPTTLLLGELDILPLGGFDNSCPAMAQGPTRLARGQAFARRVNEKFAAKHTVTIVPLCGHNARCMFTSEAALRLIFPGN